MPFTKSHVYSLVSLLLTAFAALTFIRRYIIT
nr:MAG TPA: hypothetical protein [Caudoviricetes sp.]